MATSFSSLPIVDLAALQQSRPSQQQDLQALSAKLYDAFATTGFAYLTNVPLTFTHEDIFQLTDDFFSMPTEEKMRLAKKTFVKHNQNTYRGYFPPQAGQKDNLKEGFEIGPAQTELPIAGRYNAKFDLSEGNVWPSEPYFSGGRERLEQLQAELQDMSSKLLSLLAIALGKSSDFFSSYLPNSVSTLRLLHYPPQPSEPSMRSDEVKLCCTPHTDSGILTLLHQDPTGGLEVLNSAGEWIPAPYVPGSIVVNIGDLLSQVSGGRLIATMHRVRASPARPGDATGMGRFSVPFFFEPGESCLIKSIDGGDPILYGDHVRRKMGTWVEFQDAPDTEQSTVAPSRIMVDAY